MPPVATLGIAAVVCYLIGGIPFGYLVGRLRGVDVRQAGSGNIGATNVGRVLGRPWGISVFLLDVAKGVLPTLCVGRWMEGQVTAGVWSPLAGNAWWLFCGACCILGHNYPIYLGLRGGKGVATSLGVVLGVYPYMTLAGVLAFAVWTVVTLISRYVSLGSVTAAVTLPVVVAVLTLRRGREEFVAQLPLVVFALLIGGLVVYRHRGNLARLRAGTEARIGTGARAAKSGG